VEYIAQIEGQLLSNFDCGLSVMAVGSSKGSPQFGFDGVGQYILTFIY